eukprot:4275256-Prymnesium_polylepis.1
MFTGSGHRPPALQRRLVCAHWASCSDDRRSVGSMEVGSLQAADTRQLGGLAAASLAECIATGRSEAPMPCRWLETGYSSPGLYCTT